jgi:uncharacterized RDD family membrane protein YckC
MIVTPPVAATPRVPPREAFTPWIRRVLALFIDAIPAVVLIGIGFGILASDRETACLTDVSEYDLGPFCSSGATTLGQVSFTIGAVASALYLIWNHGYRQGTTGSSVGKAVMKFRVVSEKTGQPVGFIRSLLRQLAHALDVFLCYIGYLLPLWDPKRQTLADKIMSTVCMPVR